MEVGDVGSMARGVALGIAVAPCRAVAVQLPWFAVVLRGLRLQIRLEDSLGSKSGGSLPVRSNVPSMAHRRLPQNLYDNASVGLQALV